MLANLMNGFSQQFSGQVLDSLNRQPLRYASVYLLELQTGVTTDSNGFFVLPPKISGSIHLQVSCLGYRTSIFLVDLSNEKNSLFYLSESHVQLHEVVVSTPSFKLQQDNIVSVVQKSIPELSQRSPVNLMEAISNIPGVDNYSTGTGIGKPVLRGLSGNRLVVYTQNVRIENQQWGDEHGLGIGETGIENVEVIKGPASLLYGADALGGVLYFVDERYAPHNSFQGFAASRFHSNTLGTLNSAIVKLNKNGFKMNLSGNYNSNTDYLLPSRNRVLNSRFNESGFKANMGYHFKKWAGNIRYSFLHNNVGITESDTVSNGVERRPELPFQKVQNHLLSMDNAFFFGTSKLTATLGYSQNSRKEFEDTISSPNLDLDLKSFSFNFRNNTSLLNNKMNLMTGIQGMSQQNRNLADEVLIPDATTTDIGAFLVLNFSLFWDMDVEGGIRYDYRKLSTKEMQTDDAFFPKLDRHFNNLNFALGGSYRIKRFVIRANAATGYRPPNSSELLSNGVHEGTLRYEIGDRNLDSELARQIDFSLDYKNDHFSFFINPFFNHINNYIFLSPTDSMIDNFPVFNYKQTNANLIGGETGLHWHPHPIDWLHIESNYSSVFATDASGNALPLIPANRIHTTLRGELKARGRVYLESLYVEHIYRFSQNRIAVYETSSTAYHLLNAGLVFRVNTDRDFFEVTAGLKNILNTKYTDHLSRFKTMGINNPGINAYIGLKWKWQKDNI